MSLELVRVDCRLIHGQIVEGWIPFTGADCLVVANDDLAANAYLRSVMELAVPADIHVVFCKVDEAPEVLASLDKSGEKEILLLGCIRDARAVFERGLHFGSLNVGNLHFATGKTEVTPSVFFGPEDYETVRCLCGCGVAVTVKSTPSEPGRTFEPGGGGTLT